MLTGIRCQPFKLKNIRPCFRRWVTAAPSSYSRLLLVVSKEQYLELIMYGRADSEDAPYLASEMPHSTRVFAT